MTPTNDQIVAEAQRRRDAVDAEQRWPLEDYVIDVVREGWTPPEPVDPDLLAFREWGERRFGVNTASAYRLGDCDDTAIAEAFLAGARMGREQERERAKGLVEYVEAYALRFDGCGVARRTLAKYRGEA